MGRTRTISSKNFLEMPNTIPAMITGFTGQVITGWSRSMATSKRLLEGLLKETGKRGLSWHNPRYKTLLTLP